MLKSASKRGFGETRRAVLVSILLGGAAAFMPVPAFAVQSVSVGLRWDRSPDTNVVGYVVYYGNANGVYTNFIDVGDSDTATVSGLAEGLTYYFVVTAYNIAGWESDPSNEVFFPESVEPAPCLQFDLGTTLSSGCRRIRFQGLPNRTYALQATEDFKTWTTIWNPLPLKTEQWLEFLDQETTASGMRFYRLAVY